MGGSLLKSRPLMVWACLAYVQCRERAKKDKDELQALLPEKLPPGAFLDLPKPERPLLTLLHAAFIEGGDLEGLLRHEGWPQLSDVPCGSHVYTEMNIEAMIIALEQVAEQRG